MKKLLLLVFFVMMLLLLLSSCDHTHEFGDWSIVTEATCKSEGVQQRKCECGELEEKKIPIAAHVSSEVSCTQDRVCVVCGEVLGGKHVVSEATCTKPASCELCGEVLGGKLEHVGSEATCTEHASCELCGKVFELRLGHDFETDTECLSTRTCKRCGEIGEPRGHKWKSGDCTTPKTCTECGETEGGVVHDWYSVWYGIEACRVCNLTNPPLIIYSENLESQDEMSVYSPDDSTIINCRSTVEFKVLGTTVNSVWTVDSKVNVNIEDYPIIIIVTNDLCTCNEANSCFWLENCSVTLKVDGSQYFSDKMDVYGNDISHVRNNFLSIYYDFSNEISNGLNGRIDEVLFTINNTLPSDKTDRKDFEVYFVAFFKTVEEAMQYAYYSISVMWAYD